MNIELFFDENYLNYGIRKYVVWDTEQFAHLILFGGTGSGKTYLTKLILSRISKKNPEAQIYLANYKGDSKDFGAIQGSKRYYSFSECERALDEFKGMFEKRMSGKDTTRTFQLLLFDEWASYLANLDKKKAEEEKKKLGTILMMGRSYNLHVIISQQRCDSVHFSAGTRDQFGIVIALGSLSSEGKDMMFREFKDKMTPKTRGTGYLTDGTNLIAIRVPTIRDMKKVDEYIKDAVNR